MKFLTTVLSSLALSAAAILSQSTAASAQTLEAEGVVGDMDRSSRNPHLTVGVTVGKSEVTILADAFHPSDEFQKYPIQFDFFVNRKLFSSQYRSVKLPGPIGITVPSSEATVPFNYVVVAKVIHPNSIYTTVIEGAATSDSTGKTPVGNLDCTLTVTEGEDTKLYTASSVILKQSSETSYSADFTAKSADGKSSVSVVSEVKVTSNNDDSTGTATVSADGKKDVVISGPATIETNGSSVSKVKITSETTDDSLSCS